MRPATGEHRVGRQRKAVAVGVGQHRPADDHRHQQRRRQRQPAPGARTGTASTSFPTGAEPSGRLVRGSSADPVRGLAGCDPSAHRGSVGSARSGRGRWTLVSGPRRLLRGGPGRAGWRWRSGCGRRWRCPSAAPTVEAAAARAAAAPGGGLARHPPAARRPLDLPLRGRHRPGRWAATRSSATPASSSPSTRRSAAAWRRRARWRDRGLDWALDHLVASGDGAALGRGGRAAPGRGDARSWPRRWSSGAGPPATIATTTRLAELGRFLVRAARALRCGAPGRRPPDRAVDRQLLALLHRRDLPRPRRPAHRVGPGALGGTAAPGRPLPGRTPRRGGGLVPGDRRPLGRLRAGGAGPVARRRCAGSAPWIPDGVAALRLASLFGVQVRYESQRTNGFPSRVTRGRQTLGAGLGTIGEGLANLPTRIRPGRPCGAAPGWRARRPSALDGQRAVLVERAYVRGGDARRPPARPGPRRRRCRRRTGRSAPGTSSVSPRWTTSSTRCPRCCSVRRPAGGRAVIEPSALGRPPSSAVLLAALAAGNPPRRVASVPATPPRRLAAAAAVAAVPLLVLALGPARCSTRSPISRPTARVAAGLVLMVVGLVELVRTLRRCAGAELGVVVPLAFPCCCGPSGAGACSSPGRTTVAPWASPRRRRWRRARCRRAAGAVAPERGAPGLESSAGPATDPWAGAARFLGALGVLVGAGLLLDGILAL